MKSKSIGFPISKKENENRRALIPDDLKHIKNPHMLFFQQGYGDVLGCSDSDYTQYGAQMVSREEVLKQDIICDPKIGDAEYLSELSNQTIFGWVHAVQNKDITDVLIKQKLTAYAWEDMFREGRHVFWRNNEIAGEAAVMHAFQCYADMPYNTKVALIGMGNVAQGAYKILTLLGANTMVYTRRSESLLRKELPAYDVVVNAVLWDITRGDHLVYRDDLKRMKKGSMIIDISCDRNGGIETSIPTKISDPVYTVDGVLHYAVDHTPTLFYKTASKDISNEVCMYVDQLITGSVEKVLADAKILENGAILDERINQFQGRG